MDEDLENLRSEFEETGTDPEASGGQAAADPDAACAPKVPSGGKGSARARAAGANAPGWPAPLGEAAYHGILGTFVRALEPHTESDPAAIVFQLLAAAGNVIGSTAHWTVEADRHPCILYVALVGETSKARKGTSEGHVRAHTKHATNDEGWQIASGLASGEGIVERLRDPTDKEVEAGAEPRDKRLFVVEHELSATLRVCARDGNTLSPMVRNAWDGRDLEIIRRHNPVRATGPHMSIIGHVTIPELRRDLTRIEAANGFGNRFLFVCVRRSKLLPFGGNFKVEDDLLGKFRSALTQSHPCKPFGFTDEARDLWREVYEELSRGRPGLLGAMTARAEAQVRRIAVIYAVLNCSAVATVEHLRAALECWRYAYDSARHIFGDALGDPLADELLHALRAKPSGMTRTDISGHLGRNRDSADIGRALCVLEEAGLARTQKEPSAGKPIERWFAVR
jgi:hypothetical protein